MRKYFFSALFLLLLPLSEVHGALDLNRPVGDVFNSTPTGKALSEDLRKSDPQMATTLTLRELMHESFTKRHTVNPGLLGRIIRFLAEEGLPMNLTSSELDLLSTNPTHPYFHRVRDIQFEGYIHGPRTTAERLERNEIFFVSDFKKVFANEFKLEPKDRFRGFFLLAEDSMTRIGAAIDDHLQGRDTRIDVDQLQLSYRTRAALNLAGLTGPKTESDLKASSLDLEALSEIFVASLVARKSQSPIRKACQALLRAWESGKL